MLNDHPYRDGARGRGLHTDPSTGDRTARIYCNQCNFVGKINQKNLMPPDQIDKKFLQKGWELDPNTCPTCVAIARKARLEARRERLEEGKKPTTKPEQTEMPTLKPRYAAPNLKPAPAELNKQIDTLFTKVNEPLPKPKYVSHEKGFPPEARKKVEAYVAAIPAATAPMAAMVDNSVLEKVSENTRLATRHMHKLLREHFSEDEGRYEIGWDDARVAKESGLAPHVVANERSIAYGDFKEPAEIQSIRTEIEALHEMSDEILDAIRKVEKRLEAFVAAQGFVS